MGILVIIIIVVVIVVCVMRKSNGAGNLEEIENAILSKDLGNTDWSSLKNFLERRGISEKQYQDIRYATHKKRAENGFADSQYFYAVLNESNGNKVEAEKYYELAAQQEYIPAVHRLMHTYGEGGKFGKNPDKELYWTKKGVELGDLDAMVKLAREYAIGEIVEKNEAEEERWLRKAADLGSAEAYIGLADMLKYMGKYQEQIQWLRKAIDLAGKNNDRDTFARACYSLGWKYKPHQNNTESDAKRSEYFFFLSYVLDYCSREDVKGTGYTAQQEELEAWFEDAKNLRIRF